MVLHSEQQDLHSFPYILLTPLFYLLSHSSFSSNSHFAFTLLLFLHLHLCLFVFCFPSMSTNDQLKSAQNCKRYAEYSDDSVFLMLPLHRVT